MKETFSAQKPAQKPVFEMAAPVQSEAEAAKAAADQAWPQIVNAIDSVKNWCDEFDWEKDDGKFFPQRSGSKGNSIPLF